MDAFAAGELDKARYWQQRSIDVVDIIIRYGGGVRGGKAMMKAIGIDCGDCRSPFTPFTAEEIKNIQLELQAIDFDSIK